MKDDTPLRQQASELPSVGIRRRPRAAVTSSNTAVKLSGLGMVIHPWTVKDFRPRVETTIDMFGVHRCMFGSNFPVDWCYSEFDTLVEAFSEIVSDASQAERHALFVSTAERLYRI